MPGNSDNSTQPGKTGTSRKRLVIAFFAGMVLALVLVPAAVALLSPQPDGEPALPAAPGLHQKTSPGSELASSHTLVAEPAGRI